MISPHQSAIREFRKHPHLGACDTVWKFSGKGVKKMRCGAVCGKKDALCGIIKETI